MGCQQAMRSVGTLPRELWLGTSKLEQVDLVGWSQMLRLRGLKLSQDHF